MKPFTLALFFGFLPIGAQAGGADVYGLWLSEAKDGHIRIIDCGDGTPCGYLTWAEPQKAGAMLLDVNNRDTALRERPLIGIPIIWGFRSAKNGWKGGRIYNPEDGKTFRASVSRQSAETLILKGCLGPLCITNVWSRLPEPNSPENKNGAQDD